MCLVYRYPRRQKQLHFKFKLFQEIMWILNIHFQSIWARSIQYSSKRVEKTDLRNFWKNKIPGFGNGGEFGKFKFIERTWSCSRSIRGWTRIYWSWLRSFRIRSPFYMNLWRGENGIRVSQFIKTNVAELRDSTERSQSVHNELRSHAWTKWRNV